MCRYASRPPVATGRLSKQADGRLLYRLKHRWRDGTTHVVFEPHELRHHGQLLPCCRVFLDPEPRVRQADIVASKRLGAVLTQIQKDQQERDRQHLASPKLALRQKERIRAASS